MDPRVSSSVLALSSDSGKFQNHLLKCLHYKKDKLANLSTQPTDMAPPARDLIDNIKNEVKKGQKRKRNVEEWKKVKKSRNYNSGVGRKIREPCNCWRKCTSKITAEQRKKLFHYFWGLASGKKRGKYIVDFVKQMPIARRRTFSRNPRRHSTNHYCLPKEGIVLKEGEMVSVCQKFFLGTFDISDKVLRYNMAKPEPSSDSVTVLRAPPNKTKPVDVEFAAQHIQSLASDRKLPGGNGVKKGRENCSAGLSVRKMYQLYQSVCVREQRKPVGEHIYRSEYHKLLFCSEKVRVEQAGVWRSSACGEAELGNATTSKGPSVTEEIASLLHRSYQEEVRTFPAVSAPVAAFPYRSDLTRAMTFSDWNIAEDVGNFCEAGVTGDMPQPSNRTSAGERGDVRPGGGCSQQLCQAPSLSLPISSGLETHKPAVYSGALMSSQDSRRNSNQDVRQSSENLQMTTPPKPLRNRHEAVGKRKRNVDQWKKVKKSRSYNLGAGRKIRAPCSCWRKCGSLISEEQRKKLFDHFWALACGEKRRRYIVAFVRQMPPARRRVLHSQRLSTNHYWLPRAGVTTNDEDMTIVCQKFFLGTFDVSDKFLRYNMSKPDQSTSTLPAQRTPPNKTKPLDVEFAAKHVLSFSSGSNLMDGSRGGVENFPTGLSVRKMYQQYKLVCEREGRKPVGEHIYRAECHKLFDVSKKKGEPAEGLATADISAIGYELSTVRMAIPDTPGDNGTPGSYMHSYQQNIPDWTEGRSRLTQSQIAAILTQWPKYT